MKKIEDIVFNFDKKSKWMKKSITEAWDNANRFLCDRYNLEPGYFDEVFVKISTTCRFAYYQHDNEKREYGVRICAKEIFWHTYERVTVGKVANRIRCSVGEAFTLQMVHELTHHIQNMRGKRFGEVETTQNEIDYAEIHYPHLYDKLEDIKKG